jgi:hypothetical protein
MTATPQPAPWNVAPAPRMSAGRIVALVFGILLLVPGLGLLAGGGVLLWGALVEREDGYLFTEQDAFSTEGYALVSERVDLQTGADWVPLEAALGTVRIEATGGDEEVFIGIARLDDGTAYLDGVERAVIDDLGFDNSGTTTLPGDRPVGAPEDLGFWVESSSGTGPQSVSWVPADGEWLLVVMNADGSAGVSVDARIGATVPALAGVAWGVLGVGVVVTVVAVLLLVLAIRRPARYSAPSYAAPSTYPGGAPPAWTPPAPQDRTTAADAQPGGTTAGQVPRGPETG